MKIEPKLVKSSQILGKNLSKGRENVKFQSLSKVDFQILAPTYLLLRKPSILRESFIGFVTLRDKILYSSYGEFE